MEELAEFVTKLTTASTGNLHPTVLQEILVRTRHKKQSICEQELWNGISDILWSHMTVGLSRLDDQLLCSTCFYTVLSLTNKQEYYLEEIETLVKNEVTARLSKSKEQTKAPKTSLVVSLMYGLFQSTFLFQDFAKVVPNIENVLKEIINLLISMAYDYSRYTFLVFKIINAINKVLGTTLQGTVYCEGNLKRFLSLVNHNWENPITGVRDLNKLIFKTLVGLLNEDLYDAVLKEIINFQWNKAKYLMLSEIIEKNKKDALKFIMENDLTEGILYSLQKPGLVSAGADMYFAVLKNLKSEDDWCTLFLKGSISIFLGSNKKSIENFGNYWCLTTFKRFPQLLEIIIHELRRSKESKLKIYCNLYILKQGNKLGLLNNKQSHQTYKETKCYVLDGLEHGDPHIRMAAFEIISITQGKSLPNSNECDLILNYLQNNINSDCTVLRISMLNNFKYFITRLSDLLYTSSSHNELVAFYIKLQKMIVQSLNINGNYLRKITTIKLCDILLSSMIKKPSKERKKSELCTESSFTLLKEKDCWLLFEKDFLMVLFILLKDPADDIRECTIQLILKHYSKQITPVLTNHLIEDAINGIQSKFFYQISYGQSIFRLLANLFLKESIMETTFRSVDDIFAFAYNELYTEYNKRRNIVKTIEAGKQLHSLLGILLEVLKISKQNSYEIKSAKEKIPEIILMLDKIASQFMWDEDTSTSSDFSKMNEMIQNMIISSGYNPMHEKDSTKISGLQQIVLNCLWFNVKAACDLASFLLQLLDDDQTEECERCLTILMHVLETSRHKGVIEAAGAALGRSIQFLTSLPDESDFSNIPLSLLKCKLNELISYANMASVTRRGAGLSIMVHRIVSSDMKKGKPLFHYFMDTILETCSNAKETSGNMEEGQKDLPKAIYIHFLTRIVIDSGLASDMMFYSAELAEIAFGNLISSHWQIRNAALQLYGALIPKLIGQKKGSGTDDETIATVACDEFRTHSPKLWEHITECLRNIDAHDDIIQAHSNVMPTVNVLANLAKRYNFTFDTTATDCNKDLLDSLVVLLGSPIYTVRRLSAKCIFNIYDFETIFGTLMCKEIKSENALHGILSLVIICNGNYVLSHKNYFEELFKRYSLLFENTHSYLCKQQFEELLGIDYNLNEIQRTLKEAKHNKHAPGVFYWANYRFKKFIQCCSWGDILVVLESLLHEQDFNDYCQLIFDQRKLKNIPENILGNIVSMLSKFVNVHENTMIWKILYELSSKFQVKTGIVAGDAFQCLKNMGVTYKMRYVVPFLGSLAGQLQNDQLDILSNIVFTLCDPETSDVDMRCIAALANNEIAKTVNKITSSSTKISVIKAAVILLQDEDEDVRLISTDFYKYLSKTERSYHSYVCLSRILDKGFLQGVMNVQHRDLKELCREIEIILHNYTKKDVDEYNPFSNESKNIYLESKVVRHYLENINV